MSDQTPQNPMQESIKGYRKFSPETSAFINDVKAAGEQFQSLLGRARSLDDVADPRALALATTKFQEGAMWLIRAAAKQEGLF